MHPNTTSKFPDHKTIHRANISKQQKIEDDIQTIHSGSVPLIWL